MNEEKIIDAIGDIDESLLLETHNLRIRKRTVFPYKAAAVIAACILLTVALLPWKRMLSGNDPSVTDAPNTDVLQNDETSFFDTTDKKDDSPIAVPESTHGDTQRSTQSPDIPDAEDAVTTFTPAVTLPPAPDVQKSPETTGPYIESPDETDTEDTTAVEKETTGPVIPETPLTPDHGIVLPQYPTILSRALYPVQDQYPTSEALRKEWREITAVRINYYKDRIGNIDSFMARMAQQLFANYQNSNFVYSPVNAYLSLGTLAEATAGNSQAQLLELLGEEDIYSLRRSAESVWNGCYRDDGIVTSILGTSMWFDDMFVPNTSVTEVISDYYYASSFWGNMGEENYDKLMQSWINEQTNGLLKNSVSQYKFNTLDVMSVVSTAYFKADWSSVFAKQYTRSAVFHSPNGDITAKFMYRGESELYYEGENFSATRLQFKEGGSMWFILPDEDVNLQSLFKDTEAVDFITGKVQKDTSSFKSSKIHLYLPKFDITTDIDLKNNLINMGVTDVFDDLKANFSPLTNKDIYAKNLCSSVRLRIDEYGCEGVAVTKWTGGIGGAQPITFKINRPFIFVVISDVGLPLFVGTVNYPN
ncbi:MAG: hypothetical protein IJA52_00985 [Clostridia bacterium]|nr:hypothetical protein [Clostridia bacterium]